MYSFSELDSLESQPPPLLAVLFKYSEIYLIGGLSDEPFFLVFVDGLREWWLSPDDGRVGGLGRLRSLGLIGVVGPLVAEHIANQEHQCAEDGEYHHGDDTCTGIGLLTTGRQTVIL